SQTDLPFGKKSGLGVAAKILKNIDDIAIHHFTERDVVRHKLVQKIILAYERYEREQSRAKEQTKSAKGGGRKPREK
ncbi:MAG: PhoH family protein, partial [Clostridia bacterium]|nr:PhoH family protein [Clostridia bacterium]